MAWLGAYKELQQFGMGASILKKSLPSKRDYGATKLLPQMRTSQELNLGKN